ncbi:transposase [Fulvivirga sp. M361]|uniref:REP-associated tyrosine transposase n=1 Tax=Fulvivirga sp. M361 TaxID=2594266 RepID=UPI00117A0121|nr:transposase [Fulvivirga sp. M361]TRX62032.1 transposase [Fulvivirga sp. M361]
MSTKYRVIDDQVPHFLTLTIVEWIDLFSRQIYKDIFMDSLRFCVENKGLVLHAFVVMTNHVHLIASSKEGIKLTNVIRDLKRFTASEIYEAVRKEPGESRRNWLIWLLDSQGERSSSNVNYKVWLHENHPVMLDTNGLIDQKLNYLHQNPVKAGICFTAEDYVYSSAANYAGETGIMDVVFLD